MRFGAARGGAELGSLQLASDKSPTSRKAREALIRALIRHGRSVEALSAARRFVEIDPDHSRAFDLLAYAAAAAADPELAFAAIDAQAEIAPRDSRAHHRAAEALSAAGDEARACAHWRSLDELNPHNDSYVAEVLVCRYRVFGERAAVLEAARAIQKPGPLLDSLLKEIEAGNVSPHVATAANVGQFRASMQCETPLRPTLLVIAPNGSVLSPFTPWVNGSAKDSSLTFSGLVSGTYRTVLIGGAAEARGTVEVSVLGNTHSFEFARGAIEQTIATTTVFIATPEVIEASRRRWWRDHQLPVVQ